MKNIITKKTISFFMIMVILFGNFFYQGKKQEIKGFKNTINFSEIKKDKIEFMDAEKGKVFMSFIYNIHLSNVEASGEIYNYITGRYTAGTEEYFSAQCAFLITLDFYVQKNLGSSTGTAQLACDSLIKHLEENYNLESNDGIAEANGILGKVKNNIKNIIKYTLEIDDDVVLETILSAYKEVASVNDKTETLINSTKTFIYSTVLLINNNNQRGYDFFNTYLGNRSGADMGWFDFVMETYVTANSSFLDGLNRFLSKCGFGNSWTDEDMQRLICEFAEFTYHSKLENNEYAQQNLPIFYGDGKVYSLINQPYTWSEAELYCERLGGHLVTITSSEEQKMIEDIITSHGNKDYYWCGATQEDLNDEWEWITGEIWNYINWDVNEPNNHEGNFENALELISNSGKWNDEEDDGSNSSIERLASHGFVCEWDEYSSGYPGIDENINVSDVENNCTDYGYITVEKDDTTYYSNFNAPKGHTYSYIESIAPTCTEEGYDKYQCDDCLEIEKRNIVSAIGHNYLYNKTIEKTCQTRGYDVYECNNCGVTKNQNYVEASCEDSVVKIKPSCLSSYFNKSICNVCKKITYENVALGKTVTSSTNQDLDYKCKYVADGDNSTRWASEYGEDDAWIEIDLEEVYLIDKVIINWETAYGEDYNILVSSDGNNWITISEKRSQNGGVDIAAFKPIETRYLKIQGIKRGTEYGYSIFEIEAYCDEGNCLGEEYSNISEHQYEIVESNGTTMEKCKICGCSTTGFKLSDHNYGNYTWNKFNDMSGKDLNEKYYYSTDLTEILDTIGIMNYNSGTSTYIMANYPISYVTVNDIQIDDINIMGAGAYISLEYYTQYINEVVVGSLYGAEEIMLVMNKDYGDIEEPDEETITELEKEGYEACITGKNTYVGEWGYHVASDWAGATALYKAGNSIDSFTLHVLTNDQLSWGVQAFTEPQELIVGKEYTVTVTVDSSSEANSVIFKDDVADLTFETKALVVGENTFTGTFTATNDTAEFFFDLGFVPAGTTWTVTSFSLMPTSETDATEVVVSDDVNIEGYQISSYREGSRVVGSVEPVINNQNVIKWGFVYSINELNGIVLSVNEKDLYVGSDNEYVSIKESTSAGTASSQLGDSKTATYFVRTTLFGNKNVSEFTAKYSVRAYAQLEDGTYVYSEVSDYSVFDVAKKLYDNKMMNKAEGHNYLYNEILYAVDNTYQKVDYDWSNIIVKYKDII